MNQDTYFTNEVQENIVFRFRHDSEHRKVYNGGTHIGMIFKCMRSAEMYELSVAIH